MTDFFVTPQVVGGDPSLQTQNRLKINDLRHDNPFCRTRSLWRASIPLRSSPQVVSGDPSEKDQDRFPIENVGNDAHGERFLINIDAHQIPSPPLGVRVGQYHAKVQTLSCPFEKHILDIDSSRPFLKFSHIKTVILWIIQEYFLFKLTARLLFWLCFRYFSL